MANSNGVSYGNCNRYTDVDLFTDEFKQNTEYMCLSSMDTFQNFFFWTWKTQSNLDTGKPYNPLWYYSCGLEYGYVPQDPAAAAGACPRIARQLGQGGYGSNVPLTETLAASMTGNAATTSSVVAAQRSSYGQWPPTSITNIAQATNLPRYTATGAEPNYPTTLVTPLSSVATGAPKACDWYTSAPRSQDASAQVTARQLAPAQSRLLQLH